jgi:hypothetical protein
VARDLTGSHSGVPLVSLLSAKLLAPLVPALTAGALASVAAPPASAAPAALLSAHRPSSPQTGRRFPGMPQFGELVWQNPDGTPGARLCTAVSVHSAGGDLIATAAHCLDGVQARIGGSMTVAYLPGADGTAQPYGTWYPTRIIRPGQWMNGVRNPDFDIAFVTVEQPGTTSTLESLTGSEHFGRIPARGSLGVQIGYPDAGADPLACRTPIRFRSRTQLELHCAAFVSGTSGGPILTGVRRGDGVGTLVGVVGGYQRGGTRDDISYASAFTPAIQRLYRQAARY